MLEPYQLDPAERAGFWEDVLFAAERLARLVPLDELREALA